MTERNTEYTVRSCSEQGLPASIITNRCRVLLPPVFTLTLYCYKAVFFCGTFHRLTPSELALGALFVRSPDFPQKNSFAIVFRTVFQNSTPKSTTIRITIILAIVDGAWCCRRSQIYVQLREKKKKMLFLGVIRGRI